MDDPTKPPIFDPAAIEQLSGCWSFVASVVSSYYRALTDLGIPDELKFALVETMHEKMVDTMLPSTA